jgi:hypothetical protein
MREDGDASARQDTSPTKACSYGACTLKKRAIAQSFTKSREGSPLRKA